MKILAYRTLVGQASEFIAERIRLVPAPLIKEVLNYMKVNFADKSLILSDDISKKGWAKTALEYLVFDPVGRALSNAITYLGLAAAAGPYALAITSLIGAGSIIADKKVMAMEDSNAKNIATKIMQITRVGMSAAINPWLGVASIANIAMNYYGNKLIQSGDTSLGNILDATSFGVNLGISTAAAGIAWNNANAINLSDYAATRTAMFGVPLAAGLLSYAAVKNSGNILKIANSKAFKYTTLALTTLTLAAILSGCVSGSSLPPTVIPTETSTLPTSNLPATPVQTEAPLLSATPYPDSCVLPVYFTDGPFNEAGIDKDLEIAIYDAMGEGYDGGTINHIGNYYISATHVIWDGFTYNNLRQINVTWDQFIFSGENYKSDISIVRAPFNNGFCLPVGNIPEPGTIVEIFGKKDGEIRTLFGTVLANSDPEMSNHTDMYDRVNIKLFDTTITFDYVIGVNSMFNAPIMHVDEFAGIQTKNSQIYDLLKNQTFTYSREPIILSSATCDSGLPGTECDKLMDSNFYTSWMNDSALAPFSRAAVHFAQPKVLSTVEVYWGNACAQTYDLEIFNTYEGRPDMTARIDLSNVDKTINTDSNNGGYAVISISEIFGTPLDAKKIRIVPLEHCKIDGAEPNNFEIFEIQAIAPNPPP